MSPFPFYRGENWGNRTLSQEFLCLAVEMQHWRHGQGFDPTAAYGPGSSRPLSPPPLITSAPMAKAWRGEEQTITEGEAWPHYGCPNSQGREPSSLRSSALTQGASVEEGEPLSLGPCTAAWESLPCNSWAGRETGSSAQHWGSRTTLLGPPAQASSSTMLGQDLAPRLYSLVGKSALQGPVSQLAHLQNGLFGRLGDYSDVSYLMFIRITHSEACA